jgi:hypothetical protein
VTWFKVDDGFADHPKVDALLEGKHADGALALWTLAGCWCAKQLTDGLVPAGRIRRFGLKNPDAAAAELVRVGLWVTVPDGFQFHQWTDHQPTREQVLADRAAAAERQRRRRDKRRDESVNHGESHDGCHAVTSGEVTEPEGVSHSPPTRPDPARPKNNNMSAGADEGSLALALESPKPKRDEVAEVFEHWKRVMNHPKAELDANRKRLIAKALKSYSFDDCIAAIDGCRASDHHMGRNDRGTVYDQVDLIFRNADKIDWFVANAQRAKGFSMARGDDAGWHPTDGPPKTAANDVVWNLWIQDGCPNDRSWRPRRQGAA